MVIKVYVALISCSQEVKKNQQRAIMILESKNIQYTIIDITDPSNEECKDYMMETATTKEGAKTPLTPQVYNEADYCGDYEGLDMANETDTLGEFLKLTDDQKKAIKIGITSLISGVKTDEDKPDSSTNVSNGVSKSREGTPPQENDVNGEMITENSEITEDVKPSETEVVSDDVMMTSTNEIEKANDDTQDQAQPEDLPVPEVESETIVETETEAEIPEETAVEESSEPKPDESDTQDSFFKDEE